MGRAVSSRRWSRWPAFVQDVAGAERTAPTASPAPFRRRRHRERWMLSPCAVIPFLRFLHLFLAPLGHADAVRLFSRLPRDAADGSAKLRFIELGQNRIVAMRRSSLLKQKIRTGGLPVPARVPDSDVRRTHKSTCSARLRLTELTPLRCSLAASPSSRGLWSGCLTAGW